MVKKKKHTHTQISISLVNINTNARVCPLTQGSNLRIPTLFGIISCCSECMSRQDKKVRDIKQKGYKCQFYMNLSINWASLVAQMVKKKICLQFGDPGSIRGSGISLEKEWQPILVFVPGKPPGTGEPSGL